MSIKFQFELIIDDNSFLPINLTFDFRFNNLHKSPTKHEQRNSHAHYLQTRNRHLPASYNHHLTITATPAPTVTLYCDTFYNLIPPCVNLEAIEVSDSLAPDYSGGFFESSVSPYLSTISGDESASGCSSDDWTYGFGALTDYCNCLGIAGEDVVLSGD
jgi:hypothetical protein